MKTFSYKAVQDDQNIRLDILLSLKLDDCSRTTVQKLIKEGHILLNGADTAKARSLVQEGDEISVTFPEKKVIGALKDVSSLGVQLVFEHPDFLIVKKPAGLIVHAPHKNSEEVTLVDWLITTFTDLPKDSEDDRPGIVHRLDKDTSGLMIIARTPKSHTLFAELFQKRAIFKTYHAYVEGHPDKEGRIEFPLGRDPFQRHKISIRARFKREAITDYKAITYFEDQSLLELFPHTGRTHQIRVHCAALGHPLIGDATYGKKSHLIKRHALHAYQLAFSYENRWYSFSVDAPMDMRRLKNYFKEEKAS